MDQISAIPNKTNLAIGSAISLAILLQCLFLPLLLPDHPWIMALLVLILVPLNTPYWSLIHEAIHKNFHSGKKINEFAGRSMSVMFGASFHILRFGHLMHHQYNRDWESEFYEADSGKRFLIHANHYFKMLGGLYLAEIILTFLVAATPRVLLEKISFKLFPDEKHAQAVANSILKPATLLKIRIDALVILFFFAASFIAFAQNWPVLILLLLGRGLIISLMDNAYHYGTPLDNSIVAKELHVTSFISKFILHFNHHVTHHRNTRLPWTDLPRHREFQGNDYTESLAKALLTQFNGPLPREGK